jgi:hypothetical protein
VRSPTSGARKRVAIPCPGITILHVKSEGSGMAHEGTIGIQELTSAHTEVVCIIGSVQTQKETKIGRAHSVSD